ncbi:Vmc-like lipoprotein signal peptide domain-containing protein [Ureaplasma zalophigenitalium]|uniref:DUF1410 domain-containing protein n=1 Tax=Ureaplasma zalophigenitalium TaxID=907723 RepID=A0ABT3BNY8_9BACT|nr:hypothetical protein [Ureaplasma zalophigenitalium]MCV3753960.1 hypothetical protein [Ureaplasma zalophigenitalium]
MKKSNKRFLIASLSSLAMITSIASIAASCYTKKDDAIDWTAINQKTNISYKNSKQTKLADVPSVLTKEMFILENINTGVQVEFVRAEKANNNVTVSYKLVKDNQTSDIFTIVLDEEQFMHNHAEHNHIQQDNQSQKHPSENNNQKNENNNQKNPSSPNPSASVELSKLFVLGNPNDKMDNKFLAQTKISYVDITNGLVFVGQKEKKQYYGLHLGITRRSGAKVVAYLQEVNEQNQLVGNLIASEKKEIERSTVMASFIGLDNNKKYTLVKVELYNNQETSAFETVMTPGMKAIKVSKNSIDKNSQQTNVYLDEQNAHLTSLGERRYELKLRVDNPQVLLNKTIKVLATTNKSNVNSTVYDPDEIESSSVKYEDGFLKVVFVTVDGLPLKTSPEKCYIKSIEVTGDNKIQINTATIDEAPFYSPVQLKDKNAKVQFELAYTTSDYQWFDYNRLPSLPLNKMGTIHTNDLDGHYGTRFTSLFIQPLYDGNVLNNDLNDTTKTHSFNLWVHLLDANNKKLTKVKEGTFVVFEIQEYDLDGYKTNKPIIKSEPAQIDFAGRFFLEFKGKRSYNNIQTNLITQDMFYKIKAVKFYSDALMKQEIKDVNFTVSPDWIITTINDYRQMLAHQHLDFEDAPKPEEQPEKKPQKDQQKQEEEETEQDEEIVQEMVSAEQVLGNDFKKATYSLSVDKQKLTITLTNLNINLEALKKLYKNDYVDLDESFNFPIQFKIFAKYKTKDNNFKQVITQQYITIDKNNSQCSFDINAKDINENPELFITSISIKSDVNDGNAEFTDLDLNTKLELTKKA